MVGGSGGGFGGMAVMGLEPSLGPLRLSGVLAQECLILDPCAGKCIHRLWLLGSQVYGPFRNAGVVDKSVSHWDLDPSGYWQTVALKKLELIIGPFQVLKGHRWDFLLHGPCANRPVQGEWLGGDWS